MKFTDGYWSIPKGIKSLHPIQAYDFNISEKSFTVFAPTKQVLDRGDTLNNTVLSINFSSPMNDVVRVKISHFEGEKTSLPEFELDKTESTKVIIQQDKNETTFSSGKLTVRVSKEQPWLVEFIAENKLLTSSKSKGMGLIEKEGDGTFIHEQLSLGVGELVYGLGERFTAFVKNGQVVDIWNQDGGTASEQTYKNIPFYMTNAGYGVFVNHPEKVSFEVASEKVGRVQFSVPGQTLEYFVIYGPSPKEILEKYTALTGRPALPPPWSFGLWLTTSFTTQYDEKSVTEIIQGMSDRDLPLSVFHFDCFWMKEYHWCDFTWDERTFPDPKAMLKRLKAHGLHICLWINPYIAQRSTLFIKGMQKGYLLKKPNGSVWQTDLWQPGMGIVDFTNPAAQKWYADKLNELLDMGVDCFKTDFGERIPTEVVYYDGSDPMKMHNYYPYLYNKTVFDLLQEKRGKGEAILFARSATVGSQRFPAHWGGDCESNFEAMAESLRGGLSLGLSGFGFWSHDIGGFEGTPSPDLYKRWIAFGLLSSHSRLHGSNSYRVPWIYDDEAVNVLRKFTKLKCSLMPYLYANAVAASNKGIPMMRAMMLEFPEDPACSYLDRQYMLGDSLLVAPVFSSDHSVSYYLPSGRWMNYLNGEVKVGPGWFKETHDFMSLPLMVRPNSVIATSSDQDRPDYDYAENVTLQVFEFEEEKKVTVNIPDNNGYTKVSYEIKREGQILKLETHNNKHHWRVLLAGIHAIKNIEGGSAESTPRGILISAHQNTNVLQITLI